MNTTFDSIDRAINFSNNQLLKFQRALASANLGDGLCVVVTGSFGRKEASDESDVDFFLIHDDQVDATRAEQARAAAAAKIAESVPKAPSPDGAFNATVRIEELLRNIGGSSESNNMLTRRMLLMLEGACVYNQTLFDHIRRQILDRYISAKITNHQIALFFLNDVIRYYRTMCVDFEFKTVEQSKPWGIRNLKLMYSRKLLYFGGIVAVAESAQRSYQTKISRMLELMAMTPLERVRFLFGEQANECLGFYNRFLEKMSELEFRKSLASVSIDRETHSSQFRALKDEALHFTWSLQRLLVSRYAMEHPIHRALLF